MITPSSLDLYHHASGYALNRLNTLKSFKPKVVYSSAQILPTYIRIESKSISTNFFACRSSLYWRNPDVVAQTQVPRKRLPEDPSDLTRSFVLTRQTPFTRQTLLPPLESYFAAWARPCSSVVLLPSSWPVLVLVGRSWQPLQRPRLRNPWICSS